MRIPVAMFWSGGKDSSIALYRLLNDERYEVQALVTTISERYKRISMHGVPQALLQQQAAAIGIPLLEMEVPHAPDNSAYEVALGKIYSQLRTSGITHVAYGDIFLEDLRAYRDKLMQQAGLTGIYPLWKEDTSSLYDEFLALGFKAITVSVASPTPGPEFAGRVLDKPFKEALPPEVDPCGENGEFHTFVFDGPIFKHPVNFLVGETVARTYGGSFDIEFLFTDLMLAIHEESCPN